MRSLVPAILAGAVLIGLLFWVASITPHPTPADKARQAAQEIDKGFVGTKTLGVWRLACADKPVVLKAPAMAQPGSASADANQEPANSHGTAQAKAVVLGRCRTFLEFAPRNRPRRPVLTIAWRLAGERKALTLVVEFPPNAKKDQVVLLGVRGGTLKLPVRTCSQAGCVAVTVVGGQAQRVIFAAPGGVLSLPNVAGGRRASFRVPFLGLEPAVSAMRRVDP